MVSATDTVPRQVAGGGDFSTDIVVEIIKS